MIDYSCDKCDREFSRHCNKCIHTLDKPPTKFKPKYIFAKAIKEAEILDAALTECKTPKFRKSTPPPAPKPNPNYTPPPSAKTTCTYETPCGWCTKWDKKCDKKIGGNQPSLKMPETEAQKIMDYINSGKLPPLNTDSTCGLGLTKYD